MEIHEHSIVATVLGVAFYAAGGSPAFIGAAVASAVLIDLDHLPDYWNEHPRSFDVPHFFETCNEGKITRVYLVFHSVELLAALGIVAFFTRSALLAGTCAGSGVHLLADQLTNYSRPLTYSFIFRLGQRFDAGKIFRFPGAAGGS